MIRAVFCGISENSLISKTVFSNQISIISLSSSWKIFRNMTNINRILFLIILNKYKFDVFKNSKKHILIISISIFVLKPAEFLPVYLFVKLNRENRVISPRIELGSKV